MWSFPIIALWLVVMYGLLAGVWPFPTVALWLVVMYYLLAWVWPFPTVALWLVVISVSWQGCVVFSHCSTMIGCNLQCPGRGVWSFPTVALWLVVMYSVLAVGVAISDCLCAQFYHNRQCSWHRDTPLQPSFRWISRPVLPISLGNGKTLSSFSFSVWCVAFSVYVWLLMLKKF